MKIPRLCLSALLPCYRRFWRSGEKGNFSCDVCDKRFANKDSLCVHKRTHLAIRRSYVGEVCGCIIVTDADQDNHVCVIGMGSSTWPRDSFGSHLKHNKFLKNNAAPENINKLIEYQVNNQHG